MAEHLPVLLHETIDALVHDPGGCYVDGTFGRGGHSRLVLERLSPKGRLICLDRDYDAVHSDAARSLGDDARVQIIQTPLSHLGSVIQSLHLQQQVQGILMDLGVSSPQLDIAERGFSFMRPGPLDMRMDTTSGQTAEAWLAEVDEQALVRVLRDYGEERFAGRIARAIVRERELAPIATTVQLARLIAEAVPRHDPHKHPATRSFQAIRMAVNDELGELAAALNAAVEVLAPGGRLAVISFHSLEDRMVKRFMRDQEQGDLPRVPRHLPPPVWQPVLQRLGKAVRPSEGELTLNPRARSATLRVAARV